ncbi:MAG: PAS domain S-box protein, partial [Desulfobacterales bacterium]|nr:PAS domain S-box protein [Desulfobacterales bacterium]
GILVLHSYHQGFPWTDNVMEGMTSMLNTSGLDMEIHTEYMDTKRYSPETAFGALADLYRKKYINTRIDIILLSDNNALNFILSNREGLFPGIPVVFCGINNFSPDLLAGHDKITGVAEDIDIGGTLDLARQLMPEIRQFIVVNDRTRTGLSNRHKFNRAVSSPEYNSLSFTIYDDISAGTLKEKLGALPGDTAVLLFTFHRDRLDKWFSIDEYLDLVTGHSNRPVFSFWGHYAGKGVTAGKMVYGREQGRQSALYALRILKGEKASDIPVLQRSPNISLLDYGLAKKFGLDTEHLPENSILLNRPESVFAKYRNTIIASITVFAVLIVLVIVLAFNILSRKRAIEALQQTEEKYRRLSENSPDVIYRMTIPGGEYEYVSPSSLQIFGLTPEDCYDNSGQIREIIHPDWLDYYDAQIQRMMAGDISPTYEYQIRHSGTDARWIHERNAGIRDASGKLVAVEGIVTDITELKSAEKALKESHELFLTVMNSIDATIYVADLSTHEILFMNQYMIDTFGADFTGSLCWQSFRDETGQCPHCNNEILVDTRGKPTGAQVWHDKNPVTGKWYINHDRAIQWSDGRIVKLQIATDITDLKKMEDQLRQAIKMESVGRLAGGVAHDFNNMLSIILGNVEILLEDIDPQSPLGDNIAEVQRAAKRSADLTRQLLAFARKQTIAPKVLDLNKTVEGMLKMLGRLIGEDIDLTWHPDHALWPVKLDPSQVDQILANLCVNARDAMEDVGRLTIETANARFDEEYCRNHTGFKPGDFTAIIVSDTGCGMDRKTRENLFEPFFTTKELGEGTGLGLATVYGIIKQNNGFINVYSEVGKGTTFKIYLPRYETAKDAQAHPHRPDITCKGDETILLVEDEASMLKMTRMMLERLGYSVITANTPDEAIRISAGCGTPIHLLMTDVVMPRMNGRDLADKLTRDFPDLKCLFMSGYTANVIAHRGILDKGLNFINKPFSKQELSVKLREILDQGAAPAKAKPRS